MADTYTVTLGPSVTIENSSGDTIFNPLKAVSLSVQKATGTEPSGTLSVDATGTLAISLSIPDYSPAGKDDPNAPTFTVGTVATLDYSASATAQLVRQNTGDYVLNLGLPAGRNGTVPLVGAGNITMTGSGGNPVVNTHTDPQTGATLFDFVIPQGPVGSTPVLEMGEVRVASDGESPSAQLATNSENPNVYTMSLVLPKPLAADPLEISNCEVGKISVGDTNIDANVSVSFEKSTNTLTFDFVLPPGAKGDDGKPPVLKPGTATMLDSNSTPTFDLEKNTDGSYTVNIGIPSGQAGVTSEFTMGTITDLTSDKKPTFTIDKGAGNTYTISVGLVRGKDGVTPSFKSATATALEAGSTPTATLTPDAVTPNVYTLSFGIPIPKDGKDAVIPTFVGTKVSQLAAGSAPTFDLKLQDDGTYSVMIGVPSGFNGATPSLSIGTITTLPAGSSATATLVPSDKDPTQYTLNLSLPQGSTGDGSKLDQTTVIPTTKNPTAKLGDVVDDALGAVRKSGTTTLDTGTVFKATAVSTQSTVVTTDESGVTTNPTGIRVQGVRTTKDGDATAVTASQALVDVSIDGVDVNTKNGATLTVETQGTPAPTDPGLDNEVRLFDGKVYVHQNNVWHVFYPGKSYTPVETPDASSGTVALAFDSEGGDACFDVTLSKATTFTLNETSATAGRYQKITLKIRQPASAGFTYTLPTNNTIRYITQRAVDTTAGALEIITFETSNGGTTVEVP